MPATLSSEIFGFLQDLALNNNREWFTEHKHRYTGSQQNIIAFLEDLIREMSGFDKELAKIDAKKSLFRIYRDTRFSKDKIPYKTNFGASLGMGKGSQKGGYYLHLEPGKSFIAGGIYMPEPCVLKELRKEISLYAGDFLALINNKEFKKHFPELDQEDKLKKIPQGFEKDDPMAEYLKLKNFIVVYDLKDEEVLDENAVENLTQIFKLMKPLNDFLNTPLLQG
ncbi:TIGR02453 family protein [Chryseobacterium hagamense]|uniref:TIGR02453 family protein n=2 Tax=Chryseobacterium hagamense TaxID=395935 RepID=A0A511YQB1_9FLAO|nr:TIGR02453 family protein [Chryseobacterium hagamense]